MGGLHYVTELNVGYYNIKAVPYSSVNRFLNIFFAVSLIKKCDAIVGPNVIRYDRFQLMDFLHPWMTDRAALLIPMPTLVSDSTALIKPFTVPVSHFLFFLVSSRSYYLTFNCFKKKYRRGHLFWSPLLLWLRC